MQNSYKCVILLKKLYLFTLYKKKLKLISGGGGGILLVKHTPQSF